MAVNENIKNGVYRVWNSLESAWDKYAFWTKANRVEFNDGKDAEAKLGNIDGITDSTTSTSSKLAASAKAVSSVKTELTTEVNNIKTSFQDGCSKIAAAITSMGVSTANNASPDTMVANIKKIANKVTLSDYHVSFDCAASGSDATGIGRSAGSNITLDVTDYKTLTIGSYTLFYDSDHSAIGNDNATLGIYVDGASKSVGTSGGTIDVSKASSVKFDLKLNNAWVGPAFRVWGHITISKIQLS